MSNPLWPPTLPAFVLANGYQETLPNQVLKSQMDTGPKKRRRRFTANVRPITATVRLTLEQHAIFETFFMETLYGGALPFDWLNPISQTAASFTFDEPPVYTSVGGIYVDVTMMLEQQVV